MRTVTILLCLTLANAEAGAATPTWDEEITALPRDFDAAVSSKPGDAHDKALNDLLARAIALQERFPERGLAHAWVGWTQLELAASATDFGTKITFFQKALVNQEAAVETDPRCCGPEIYVSLAGLYQAPALGKSSDTVRRTYDRALAISPDSLLVLTRYAQYLAQNGDYEIALKHANAALKAPPLNFSRTEQDKALRETARSLIDQVNDRMKQASAVSTTK